MNKMTSDEAPDVGIDGKGILARRAENPFADWNQVFVYYCSSDNWTGGGATRDVDVEHPVSGAPLSMRLHFAGHRIIEAVVGTLRREDGTLTWDDGGAGVEIDDFDDAVEIALVGASAGGGAV